MTHSQACVDFVAKHEGCKLKAYQDQVGVWTIGYGHTYNVDPSDVITEEKAKAYLSTDLMTADYGVNKAVKRMLAQCQFDACVSLAFNIGVHAFAQSTLARELNDGNYDAAAEQFLAWNRAGGKVNDGLVKRRADERKMFLGES